MYNTYDDIAYFYNKYWTARPQELMRRCLETILLPRLKKRAKILDVCCGTGNTAAFFTGKGYCVSGIDGSALMLDYASRNAPEAEFILADARDFETACKFEAATCLFDSVNHILDGADLGKVFKNVYDSLKKGGVFLFDANTLKSASKASDMDFFSVEDGEAFMIKCDYDKKTEITSYRSTFFIKENDAWRRGDATVTEKYHSCDLLVNYLISAGFSNVTFAEGDSFGVKDFKNRLFFMAERKDG